MATSVLPSPVFISAILPLVEHRAADELHVEVPHVQHAAAGFAHDRERLGQEVVERLAVGDALAEFDGFARSCFVGQRLMDGSSALTCATSGRRRLQFAFVLGADDLGENGLEHLPDGSPDVGIQ